MTRVASGEGSSARAVDRKELDTTEKDKWLEFAKKLNAEKKMLEDDDEEEDAALSVGTAAPMAAVEAMDVVTRRGAGGDGDLPRRAR